MLRAASVGALICDNWKNESAIDKKLIIQALLIHDMGNIIKFKLDSSTMLSSEEKKNIDYWKKEQESYRNRFNNNDHEATWGIAKKIKAHKDVVYILENSGSSKLQEVIDSQNYNLGIVTYADLRCAPNAIVDLNSRFDDVVKRYKETDHALSDLEEVKKRRKLGLQLEKILKQFITIDLNDISDDSIKPYYEKLQAYDYPTY